MRKKRIITVILAASFSTILLASETAGWDFSTPGDYLYNPGQVSVATGNASLMPTANWWNAQWPYRKAITVNNTTGSAQTSIFVRINLTPDATDFWPYTTTNGFDVRFVDSSSSILPFNRASWDFASMSASFFVKVPNLAAGPNTIYLYYGNQGASDASASLLTLVGSGGVESTYVGPMDYLVVDLDTSLFVAGGNYMAFPDPGDESNLSVSLSNFANGFPYFGARYTEVKVNANGCIHPYTTNPIQMGDASFGGETTPNGPCSWAGTLDLFSVPRRLIYPHFNDKIHPLAPPLGLYVTYSGGTPSEYRFRWWSLDFNDGSFVNMMVRLKSNGNIQFDYGSVGVPGRVGISPGTGSPGILVQGYDNGNVNNANSIEFRAYKILTGNPSFSPRETQFPTNSPTIGNRVPAPFTSLLSFSQNATTPAGTEIRYILSRDATDPNDCSSAFTWLYWNGSAWTTSNQSVVQSSTPNEVADHLDSFPHLGNLCWRAFLKSDGTVTPLLDHLSVEVSQAQPDGQIAYVIGTGSPVFIGNDIFNSDGTNQSISAQASSPQTFLIRMENDGLLTDSFTILANPVPAGWTAEYYDAETGGNPIPESVITTTGYTTPTLPVGETFTIRAVYTPTVNTTPGTPMSVLFSIRSSLEPAILDAVGVTITPTFARPDLLIGTDPSFLTGAGDYSIKDYDFVEFYVCVQGAHNCNNPEEGILIATFTGTAFTWRLSHYSLQSFANQSIRLKFRMRSNASLNDAGFLLDDIVVKSSPTGSPIFDENFESGTGKWFFVNVGGIGDDWHTVSCDANSPDHSLFSGEGACGTYADQKEILAITSIPISLAGSANPFVEFWRKFALPTGSEQVLPLTGSETATFYVRLKNNGNVVGNFNLRAQGPRPGDNWSVSFVQMPFGPDLTSNILAAGQVFQLAPGEEVTLRATFSLLPSLNGGEVLTLPITATDSASPFGMDQVLASLTVESAYQPDSLIADNPEGPFLGDNLHDPTQFIEHLAGPNTTRRFYVRIQNNGNIKDDLRIKGSITNTQGNANWDVKYFDAFSGGNDITSEVTSASGYVFPGLLRDEEATVRVEVTPLPPNDSPIQFNSSLELQLMTESVSNPPASDVARLRTRVAHIVDAEVGQSQNCSNLVGWGIINTTGENQLSVLTASTSTPALFCVRIHNIGFQTALKVTGALDYTGNWDIRYFVLNSGNNTLNEVTGLFASGGYTSSVLDTGEFETVFVQMTPSPTLPDGSSFEIAITGASTASTGVVDIVKLRSSVVTVTPSTYDVDLVIDARGAGVRGALNTGDGGRTQKTVVEGTSNFTVPLLLKNGGNTTDNITLSLSANPPLPPGWVVLLNDGTQNRTFPVTLTLPAATQQLYSLIFNVPIGGTSRSIYVNGVSDSDPTALDSVAVDMTVVPRTFLADGVIDGKGQGDTGPLGSGAGGVSTHRVILLPQPYTQTEFLIDVFNRGNVPDSFLISWSTPSGWLADLVDGNVTLTSPVSTPPIQPGQSKAYIFRVQVPSSASDITRFYLDIQSQSSSDAVDSLLAGVNPTAEPSTQLLVEKGLTLPDRTVSAGATRVPILQIIGTASQLGNPVRLRGFTLRGSGSGDELKSVSRVHLWRDDDNNGVPDSLLPLAEGVYLADDGPVFLDITSVEVLAPNETRRYLVTYDFAAATASSNNPSSSARWPIQWLLAIAFMATFAFRSRRSTIIALFILFTVPLLLTSCNGGGAPVIQAAKTFRTTLDTASQVTALDQSTNQPAAVILSNPPITSAEISLQ